MLKLHVIREFRLVHLRARDSTETSLGLSGIASRFTTANGHFMTLTALPSEIIIIILQSLTAHDIAALARTSWLLNSLVGPGGL